MAETTAIEWTDSTFNPWIGCTKISPACDHCYAEALMDKRHHRVTWGGERSRTSPSYWQQPHRWQKQATAFFAAHGRRRRVFCASLADVFDNQVPPEWRDDLWALIRDTPDLDWQLLTKRPQNIGKMLPAFWDEVKAHVWLGATVEDQKRADLNIPHLLQQDAVARFVSCEPLLGPIDLVSVGAIAPPHWPFFTPEAELCRDPFCGRTGPHYPREFNCRWGVEPKGRFGLDWVIAGGESGPQARPSHPHWLRSLRDQCAAAGVPFLFKQLGEWHHRPDLAHLKPMLQVEWQRTSSLVAGVRPALMVRSGKRVTGRVLDGRTHDEFPAVRNV